MTKSFIIGAIIQGIVLGSLLLFAIWKVVMTETGARIFRYQGF